MLLETSFTCPKSVLSNSSLYESVIDLMVYLQSSSRSEAVGSSAAALQVYEKLSQGVTELVLQKLQIEDFEIVVFSSNSRKTEATVDMNSTCLTDRDRYTIGWLR